MFAHGIGEQGADEGVLTVAWNGVCKDSKAATANARTTTAPAATPPIRIKRFRVSWISRE
jgi:hypothetical protein